MDMYSMTHGPMLANYREHGDKCIVLNEVEYVRLEGETMPRFLDRVQQSHMGWHREQEYQNARKRKQEVEKGSKEASTASSSKDSQFASAGSASSDQSSLQEAEEKLEDIILSKIAFYLVRLDLLKGKQAELEHRLNNNKVEMSVIMEQCELANKALKVYHNNNDDKNIQAVSQTVGQDLSRQVIQGGQGQGTSLGQPGDPYIGSALSAGTNGTTHADLY